MSEAAERLIHQITKTGPGTLAGGAKLSARDVWRVLTEYYTLKMDYAELDEAYEELKESVS